MYAPSDIDEVMTGCFVAPSSAIRSFQFAVVPLFLDVVLDVASLGFLAQALQFCCYFPWKFPPGARACVPAAPGCSWTLSARPESAAASVGPFPWRKVVFVLGWWAPLEPSSPSLWQAKTRGFDISPKRLRIVLWGSVEFPISP